MHDSNKTRPQLIAELSMLRSRLADLEQPAQVGSKTADHNVHFEGSLPDRPSSTVPEFDALLREVAQHKQSADQLGCRVRELEVIADNVPGLISYVDVEQRFRYVNKPNEEWFGILRGNVVGLQTRDVVGADVYDSLIDEINRSLSGESVRFELPFSDSRGGPGYGLVTVIPDLDENGEINGYFCFMTDITEQRLAEDALRESEERFRQLAENIHEVFWLRSGDGRELIYVSPAYERIWGRTCESLYSNPAALREAIHVDDRESVKKGFFSARDEHREYDEEYRIVRSDGTIRWIRDRGFPIFDEAGSAYRIAGIAEDITASKRAEEQLRDYQRQLRSLASEVSLAEERERRRIAAGLHDHVGQNLALARIKSGALRETLSSPEQVAAVDELRELLEHAIRDTRSLHLELSPPVVYELGLEAAVDWLAERFQRQHGIICDVHDDGDTKPIEDDIRVVLFQAVRELLFNVVKHAGVTRASISLRRRPPYIEAHVEDEGVGFEPSVAMSGRTEGSGFGLFSICERINFLGGQVHVDSSPGKGTRVTIRAPLKETE
jgi:PAS domain S-box-containing protein